jgi:DNA polymerase III alpha subunit
MSIDSLLTKLTNRDLRYDGVTIVDSDVVVHMIKCGLQPSQLRVRNPSDEVNTYNKLVPNDPLKTDTPEPITFDRSWLLPDYVQAMNIQQHVIDKLQAKILTGCYTQHAQVEEAIKRTEAELALFTKHGMVDLLRCLVHVFEEFKKAGVVYGVGRGSSCASYVLHLIGVHMVDPIIYSIPIEEFFKEEDVVEG